MTAAQSLYQGGRFVGEHGSPEHGAHIAVRGTLDAEDAKERHYFLEMLRALGEDDEALTLGMIEAYPLGMTSQREHADEYRAELRAVATGAVKVALAGDKLVEQPEAAEFDLTPIGPPKPQPFDPKLSRVGDIFTVSPPAPRFVVTGYLPAACGQENAIGGAGKTTRQMREEIEIILNRPVYGRYPVAQPGPIVIATKEDGAAIFKFRLHHVAEAMDLSEADRKRVAEHFHVLDLTGDVGGRLVEVDRNGNLRATALAERIIEGFRGEGVSLVGFDPWNLFGPGERFVNDAEASLMAAGALISRELGCCVRYTGHVSKTVGRSGIVDAHSGRGGAAMGDNARFVTSYVQHDPSSDKEWAPPKGAGSAAERGDLYRLHITKQSYAPRPLDPLWIVRSGYGFEVIEGEPASAQDAQQAAALRVQEFVQQELAHGIKYSARGLAEQHERYSLTRNRARAIGEWLVAKGGLVARPLPPGECQGRRTEYLEPVFPPESPLPATSEALFQ